MRFTEEAQEVFDRWRNELEGRLRTAELPPALESHLAKYRSFMPSLALVFQLIGFADGTGEGGAVGRRSALRAAAWCEYLETHAARLYSSAENPAMEGARALLDRIRNGDVSDSDSTRSVYRKHWAKLSTPEEVSGACAVLEEFGWLRIESVKTGGRSTSKLHLHPGLREEEGLLSLLAPSHSRDSESCALRKGRRENGSPTRKRPWLDALRSVEEKTSKEEEKRAARVLSSSVDEIPEPLVQRGDKSAKSPPPSPDNEGTSCNTTDAKPREARRTLVTAQDQMARVVADLKDADLVALDLETAGLDPREDSIRLLSLATSSGTYIADCQSVDPAGLFPILTEATVVAHNALFDLSFLASSGFVPGKVADTMILSQLLYAGAKVEPLKRGQTSHSLDSVVQRELGLELDKIGEADLSHVAEIEHRALPAVVWMSSTGVPIDADGWREHARKTEADSARLKDELKVLAPEHPDGKAWNLDSHQHVRKAAKLLGVDLPHTRDETLALHAKEHRFIATLREYRKASKLASTYGAGWLESGRYRNGRVYASWRQLRAATGRMACDHPNLQNIPRSGSLRSNIRAPEGRLFVIADYSQIELRIAAKISGDSAMRSAYTDGRDLHTLTAQSLIGREEISKDDRKLAKAVNFGLLYGMGAQGLQSYALRSYGVEMGLDEAALYRRRFSETYPGLRGWHERERHAWLRGDIETRTLAGRRRTNIKKLTDRLNAPVQGTGADGLKLALALLWERRDECPGVTPVLVCHDEVVVECDADQAADAKAWLESAMIEGMDTVMNSTDEVDVPVEVDARIARSWGEGS